MRQHLTKLRLRWSAVFKGLLFLLGFLYLSSRHALDINSGYKKKKDLIQTYIDNIKTKAKSSDATATLDFSGRPWNSQLGKYGKVQKNVPRSLYSSTRVSFTYWFIFQKQLINFVCQFPFALAHSLTLSCSKVLNLNSHMDVDEQVIIDFFFNTALASFATVERTRKRLTFTLAFVGVALPQQINKFDNRILVVLSVPVDETLERQDFTKGYIKDLRGNELTTRISGGKVERFDVNGQEVNDLNEQLKYIDHLAATVIHPMIHSYFDIHAQSKSQNSAVFSDLFQDGLILNYMADENPSYGYGVPCGWLALALEHNSRLPVSIHSETVFELSKYSLYYLFILHSRQATFKTVRKHKRRKDVSLNVDPEILFIVTILHSIDHFFSAVVLNPYYRSWQGFPMVTSRFFYYPAQWPFSNQLETKKKKDPYYLDWYTNILNAGENATVVPPQFKSGWRILAKQIVVSLSV